MLIFTIVKNTFHADLPTFVHMGGGGGVDFYLAAHEGK